MIDHQFKAGIQNKLDKIIRREFLNPCPNFLDKTMKFNEKLINTISSLSYCQKNVKNSLNFHYSLENKSDLKYINEANTYLNDPAHLYKILNQQFSPDELKHVILNIDLFIKNEGLKKYFPKIKRISIEDRFKKEESFSPHCLKEKSKSLPMIVPYDMKDQVKPGLTDNIKNTIIKQFYNERDILNKKREKHERNEMEIRKILLKMNDRFINIKREVKHFRHPLLDYYLQKKSKKEKIKNKSCGHLNIEIEKYQELHKRNKNEIIFLNKLKDNLYSKRKFLHKIKKEENNSICS